MSFTTSFWLFWPLFQRLSGIALAVPYFLMASERVTMIANVVTLVILLILIMVYCEVTTGLFVFFTVTNALIIAAAIGFTRSLEVMRLMDASGTLDYALWSDFAGLFIGSAIICFCVLVSFFEILDFERYDY